MNLKTQISFIFAAIAIIISCSKKEIEFEVLSTNSLEGKWYTNADIGIQSIEFNKSLSYILVELNQDSVVSHYGNYEIINNSEIRLFNFGVLSNVNKLNGHLDFAIENVNEGIIFYNSDMVVETISSSIQSETLCQTWKLISIDGEIVEGTGEELHVIFSQVGTYFVSYINYDNNFISQWMWKDNTEDVLCYSHNGEPICEENENEVSIIELTTSQLVTVDDNGETFVLEPL
jgi:hypothetical protein